MKRRVFLSSWDWKWALRWPHLALRELRDEIRAFVGRGLYGYSRQDRWGLCAYLAQWLPCAIGEMVQEGTWGYPGSITSKEWDDILRQMATDLEAGWTLECIKYETPEDVAALQEQFNRGLALFSQWYWDLGD